MAQYLIGERCSQHIGTLVKTTFLFVYKIFLCRIVGCSEMAENGTNGYGILMAETIDQFLHLWILEAQAMHAGVDLDMHRIIGYTHALCLFDESIQESETIDFGFQAILDNRAEGSHLGIHHHDASTDALTSKFSTFICHCNSQVIDVLVLQCLGQFVTACTIPECFHHARQLCLGLEMTAITVQVVNDGIEVNLKYGFMTTKLQFIANAFKLIGTCSLEKNQFVLELLNRFAFK